VARHPSPVRGRRVRYLAGVVGAVGIAAAQFSEHGD
jgi:hypothetical protein